MEVVDLQVPLGISCREETLVCDVTCGGGRRRAETFKRSRLLIDFQESGLQSSLFISWLVRATPSTPPSIRRQPS